MPLVLHGGSGSGDENIKRCVEFGINKINVGCDFMNANVDSIKQHLKKDPDINYWVMMHQVEIDSQELVKNISTYKMSRPNVQKILYKNVQLVCLS